VAEGSEDGCNSLRPPNINSETRAIRVDVLAFDEVAFRLGLTNVDFVKLDVEGAELDVLKGASQLLQSGHRPVFLVEVYDIRTNPWGYRAADIVRFLGGCGFKWFRLLADGTPQPIAHDLDAYDMNLVAIPAESVVPVLTNWQVGENPGQKS
jgi:hypothetical protein